MRPWRIVLVAAVAFAVAACAVLRRPPPVFGTFTLQCDPFDGLAEHQPSIDDRCGLDGVGSTNSVAQNRVKNNFCAPAPSTVIDVGTLRTLQDDVPALGIAFGSPCGCTKTALMSTTADASLMRRSLYDA